MGEVYCSIPYVPKEEGIPSGVICLGANNPSAMNRLVYFAKKIAKKEEPLPQSPFCEWAADRITGTDRQDLVMFLQGRRGSGKSYTALYLGKRLGQSIAKRRGGKWKDYFSLNNCCTLEDNEKVLALLNSAGMYQVVLIDDCSLAISNRAWNSPQNRNFNALLSVCRTNRWILLLTAPLKKHVDNQTREMCDITAQVYKSYHHEGFNVIKATSAEISTSGKEYTHKLNFCKRKMDFWVAFKPDEQLTRDYDIQREESAKRLNARIVTTGTYMGEAVQKPKKNLSAENAESFISEHGAELVDMLNKNPKLSITKMSAHFAVSFQKMATIAERVKRENGFV
jgi:hypothetical protein